MAWCELVTWERERLNSILDVCTLNLVAELFSATLENEMTLCINYDMAYYS